MGSECLAVDQGQLSRSEGKSFARGQNRDIKNKCPVSVVTNRCLDIARVTFPNSTFDTFKALVPEVRLCDYGALGKLL